MLTPYFEDPIEPNSPTESGLSKLFTFIAACGIYGTGLSILGGLLIPQITNFQQMAELAAGATVAIGIMSSIDSLIDNSGPRI